MAITPATDLAIPAQYPQQPFLNFTRDEQIIDRAYPRLSTPRGSFDGLVSAPNAASKCQMLASSDYKNDKSKLYSHDYNTTCTKANIKLLIIDSDRENYLQVGREYKYGPLQGNQAMLHRKKADYFGVNIGDTIIVEFNAGPLLEVLLERYNYVSPIDRRVDRATVRNEYLRIPYVVHDIFSDLGGKVPDNQNDATIILENQHFLNYIADYFPQTLIDRDGDYPAFLTYMKNELRLRDFSTDIVINLPPPRLEYYLNPNYDAIQAKVTGMASSISEMLGTFSFDMTIPVLEKLYPLRFGALFLGITLNIIIFVLFVLSVLLIYSLLMVSIDTKTFEIGVLRMVGLNKNGLIQLIIVQALTFVIPAIIVGLLLTIPVLAYVSGFFQSAVGITLAPLPTTSGFIWSITLGLLIPLLSSLYPIREALSQSLSQSLDTTHSKTSAIHVSIEIDSKKIPWTKIWFGIISIAFGVSIYYLLPLSLLSFNLSLLLAIFFWILIGLLFGLVLLSLNIQHLVERVVTFVFLFWQHSSLRSLALKNLIAHRLRNRKTAIMYSLSLGFAIFISVSYSMELETASYQVKQQHGVYLEVTAGKEYLDPQVIGDFIDKNLKDKIEDYGWVTDELDNYMENKGARSVYITNIGQLYNFNPKIVGVSPNIFKISFPEYLTVAQQDRENGLDLLEQLYTPQGSQSMVLGEFYRAKLDLSLDKDSTFLVKVYNGIFTRTHEMRVASVLNSAPAFLFSQIPSVTMQNTLVSLPTFMRLASLNESEHGVNALPMKRLLFKFKNYNDADVSHVYNEFLKFRDTLGTDYTIWDYRDFAKNLEKSAGVVSIVFVAVTVIVMFLCFFSLISSMSANILEQSKEIAILRAVGLTKNQLILLYIDEAFVLVFSSSLLGILIGTLVGWTMTIQRVLFTQLPIRFVFPTTNLIAVFVASVVCAILSSYVPARRMLKNAISQIIRLSQTLTN
eukprot:TRINITY_DN5182_c0_g1_i1.p1 TRINITY_DN5182_c0_g1~~TRINITY_DN5182_c0_g1_i1.p1  ORF type:complete len:963 (+),score=283.19 TRINITY_DN5182_c0_g1_i1:176-3064(+)